MKKRNFWQAITSKQHFFVFLLGISSGLPYLLLGSTLRLWFKNVEIDIKTIGASTLVMLPYTWKFIWAPILDRYSLPFLGRRTGWIIVFQIALAISLFVLAQISPTEHTYLMLGVASVCAFFSSSQDIVIDAYRREILPEEELGLGSSLAVTGYRIGMLFATSLAPILSDHISWGQVYTVMAFIMLVCAIPTLFAPEPEINIPGPTSLLDSVMGPIKEYLSRSNAFGVLVFILLYKIGDSMASGLFKAFYSDIGYSNTQIGAIAGPIGIWAAIIGGIIGGSLQMKFGLKKCLWYFGILQALSTALFALLTIFAPSLIALSLVIFFETFTSGLGTAAYSAFMASLTDKRFTATQYALLTSIMSVPAILLGSSSGLIQEKIGWSGFFIFCAIIALPGILMLFKFDKWHTIHES